MTIAKVFHGVKRLIKLFRFTKKFYKYLIIFLLALFAIKPYLNVGFPYTHDGENHLARFANYKVALKELQFPPRFAPNLFNHYGYPVLNYNYPLANILSLPFSFLKINYELTFKIIVFSFLLLGLLKAYQWLKLLNFKTGSIFFALLGFVLSPYLVNIIYFRGNIGELMSISLFIWLFYLIEKNKQQELPPKLIFINFSIVLSAFLLSHNIAAMFGIPILFLYFIFNKRKNWKIILLSFLNSILLTVWFWLPAIFEKNQVVLDNASFFNDYLNHFPTLKQLLFSPLNFGFSLTSQLDTLGFPIGLITVISLLITLVIFFKNKLKLKDNIIFFFTLDLLLIIFQLKITAGFWQMVPLVSYIQFPWRLTLFLTITAVPLFAYVWQKVKPSLKLVLLFIIFIQFIVIKSLKPIDYFHKTNTEYDSFPQSTSTQNESLPKTFTYLLIGDYKPSPSIFQGAGEINNINWSGSKRSYHLNLTAESIITEPTMKYLGWETKASGQIVEYTDSDEIAGRIAYLLPSGEYDIESSFTQHTPARTIGNWTSLLTLLVFIIYICLPKRKLPK